jgi:hypothetical protein
VKRLRLELARLPDFDAVGGNARHGHPHALARARANERDAWVAAILEAGQRMGPRSVALIDGPACLRFELHFRHMCRVDKDNAAYALKVLQDLTEMATANKVGATKGYLGWVRTDAQYGWRIEWERVENSVKAPLTVVEAWAER